MEASLHQDQMIAQWGPGTQSLGSAYQYLNTLATQPALQFPGHQMEVNLHQNQAMTFGSGT